MFEQTVSVPSNISYKSFKSLKIYLSSLHVHRCFRSLYHVFERGLRQAHFCGMDFLCTGKGRQDIRYSMTAFLFKTMWFYDTKRPVES